MKQLEPQPPETIAAGSMEIHSLRVMQDGAWLVGYPDQPVTIQKGDHFSVSVSEDKQTLIVSILRLNEADAEVRFGLTTEEKP